MILRELLSSGILFIAIAGLYALLALVAWSLQGALLEVARRPSISTLTNVLLCSRTVFAFASSILLFAALMTFRTLGGQYSGRDREGVVAATIFWWAVAISYALVWYAIYVTK